MQVSPCYQHLSKACGYIVITMQRKLAFFLCRMLGEKILCDQDCLQVATLTAMRKPTLQPVQE